MTVLSHPGAPTMPEPSTTLRAVIASDNFLTREGLGCLLSGVPDIEVVARVDSHPETLAAIRKYRPDVLIVGIRTPRVDAEAALGAAQQLRAQHPSLGVVVISEACDGYALELLRSRSRRRRLPARRPGRRPRNAAQRHPRRPRRRHRSGSFDRQCPRAAPAALRAGRAHPPGTRRSRRNGGRSRQQRDRPAPDCVTKAVEGHVTSIFRKLRVPDAKRFDRRVAAVLAYLQASGELAAQEAIPPNHGPGG